VRSNGKPRVYSYTRFSSLPQTDGDSQRRQDEAIDNAIGKALADAKRFADAKGLLLDETLRMVDKGTSGFHGVNRTKGALGIFLKRVEAGEVAAGSILLVENLDRLSREPVMTAQETIFALLKRGITIETLSPPDTFTVESYNNGGHWRLGAHIDRAHSESKRKSELLKAAWNQKRRVAGKDSWLTSQAPAWFKIVTHKEGERVVSREVTVIPEAKETIQRIFKLRLAGFGKRTIEKQLNADATWTPPKNRKRKTAGWRHSYIAKILTNRAVIGEFQAYRKVDGKRVPEGDPKPNYFEPIVDVQTFEAVQRRLGKTNGGRADKWWNVLRHLVRCGYCGGTIDFVDRGKSPKGGQYLMCNNLRRGVLVLSREDLSWGEKGKSCVQITRHRCPSKGVRYAEVEETVLDNCSRLRPEQILPTTDEQTAELKRLRMRVEGLSAELLRIEEKKNKVVDDLEQMNSELRARCLQRFDKLTEDQKRAELDRSAAEKALRELERVKNTFEEWQRNLDGLKKAIRTDKNCRVALNSHLKEFISRIDIFGNGHEVNVEKVTAIIAYSMPEMERAKSYPAFRRYLEKRLVSPDGRFFRLHLRLPVRSPEKPKEFKLKGKMHQLAPTKRDNSGIPLAPKDSLAHRVEIRGKNLTFEGPNLKLLGEEFFDWRRPGYVPKASVIERL
jgi:DNA invertase Pin-like site-specific DNA recombinase